MEVKKKDKKAQSIRSKKKPLNRAATIIPQCNRCGARILSCQPRRTGIRRGKRLVTAAHSRTIRKESKSPRGVIDPLLCLLADVNRLRDLLLEALQEMGEEHADTPTSSERRQSDFYREEGAPEFDASKEQSMGDKGKVRNGKAEGKNGTFLQNGKTFSEIKSDFTFKGTLKKAMHDWWKCEHDDPLQSYRTMVLQSPFFSSCDSLSSPKAVLVDMILSWADEMVLCASRSSPSSKKEENQEALCTPLRRILCEGLSALDDTRRHNPHDHHFCSPSRLDATNEMCSLLVLPSTASSLPCDRCRCPALQNYPSLSPPMYSLRSSTTLEGAEVAPLATFSVECPPSLSGGGTAIRKDEEIDEPQNSVATMRESSPHETNEDILPCVQFLGSLSREEAETLLQQCKFYEKRLKAASSQMCSHFHSLCMHPVPSALVGHEKYAAAGTTRSMLQKNEEEEEMRENKGENEENNTSQRDRAEKAQENRHRNMENLISPPSLHGITRNFDERIQLYDALASCQNSARTSFITFSDALELYVSETLTVFQREKEYWKNVEKVEAEYEVLEELRELLHYFRHSLSVCLLENREAGTSEFPQESCN